MKPSERQSIIVRTLRNEGRVSVDKLVSQLGTSPETIRRDLTALSTLGKLQKVHGGAILPRDIGEGAFQERIKENVADKLKIAGKACKLISSGDSLFIDTGSTTLIFAEELASIDNLTVVTNSADIAKILGAQSTSQVYLVGGRYNAENHETFGSLAISQLQQFQMDYACITAGAVDANVGVMDFNIEEAEVAKTMVEQAHKTIVLADESKLSKTAPFKVSSLEKINYLVTNSTTDIELRNALEKQNIEIL